MSKLTTRAKTEPKEILKRLVIIDIPANWKKIRHQGEQKINYEKTIRLEVVVKGFYRKINISKDETFEYIITELPNNIIRWRIIQKGDRE